MEDEQGITIEIRKLEDGFAVTIDAPDGVVVDEDYYKPKTVEEVANLIEVWLHSFYGS